MLRAFSIAAALILASFAGPGDVQSVRTADAQKARSAKAKNGKKGRANPSSRRITTIPSHRRVRSASLSNGNGKPKLNRSRNNESASAKKQRRLLLDAGISSIRIDKAMRHIELGMPSNATTKSPEDFLLARNQYIASYSRSKKVPNWVSWRITGKDIAKDNLGVRTGDFRSDPTLPKSWGRAGKMDYKRSGYTRGHLVASSERQRNQRGNSKTFVYTNMLPQIAENNGGPWLHLENHYRDQVIDHKMEVYVMAGGIYQGPKVTIGRNEVAVPSATWKIAVLVKKGTGLSEINAATRIISVIVPNEVGKVQMSQPFTDFRVSPRAIEKLTGLSFFSHLPGDVRKSLLSKVDTEVVTKKKKRKKQ